MGRVGSLRSEWHVFIFEGARQGHSLEPGTQEVLSAHLLSGHMHAGGMGLPGLSVGEGAVVTRQLQSTGPIPQPH